MLYSYNFVRLETPNSYYGELLIIEVIIVRPSACSSDILT